jgi:hypothetical protein
VGPPALRQDLHFLERVEQLAIQKLLTHVFLERFPARALLRIQ